MTFQKKQAPSEPVRQSFENPVKIVKAMTNIPMASSAKPQPGAPFSLQYGCIGGDNTQLSARKMQWRIVAKGKSFQCELPASLIFNDERSAQAKFAEIREQYGF